MAKQKTIKGILGNFLGTYVSQNSRFNGCLLFGFLVQELDELIINLLEQSVPGELSAKSAAIVLARAKFVDQCRKAGLETSSIQEACLTIRRSPDMILETVEGQPCLGYGVRFRATARMKCGNVFEREKNVFIAPNQAVMEMRKKNCPEKPPWQ